MRITNPLNPEDVQNQLRQLIETADERDAISTLAATLTRAVEIEKIIPDSFSNYRPLVRDGLEFLLRRQPLAELLETAQELLNQNGLTADKTKLTYLLASRFPTLQKLCQTIARNEHLESTVKKWLVQLESDHEQELDAKLTAKLKRELKKAGKQLEVFPEKLLAQASVAAVILCSRKQRESVESKPFVVKLLKPGIKRKLDRELKIVHELALYLEGNKERYKLRQLPVHQLFDDLREILEAETNLAEERHYLQLAREMFSNMATINIPQLGSVHTTAMSSMEYIPGTKVTDALLTRLERKQAATTLCEALICRVIFSNSENSLFHGDPHAGNILAYRCDEKEAVVLSPIDWSLAGSLKIAERISLVRLILAIARRDIASIWRTITELAVNSAYLDSKPEKGWQTVVENHCRQKEFTEVSLVRKSLWLVGELSLSGVQFSAELLLFRKAIFTLEGVLHDLDQSFDLDKEMMHYLSQLLWTEAPQRFQRAMFFERERPENYSSLITTTELQRLTHTLYLQLSIKACSPFFQPWPGFTTGFKM